MSRERREQSRNCLVYRSARVADLYLYVPAARGLEAVPEDLLERLGRLVEVLELELWPGRPMARVEAESVLQALEKVGYFVQWPPRPGVAPAR